MTDFEQKINRLNEKLISLSNNHHQNPNDSNQQIQDFTLLLQNLSDKQKKYLDNFQARSREIENYIEEHLQYLLRMEVLEDKKIEAKFEEHQEQRQSMIKEAEQNQEHNYQNLNKMECNFIEQFQSNKSEFTTQNKKIMREIEKQMGNLNKIMKFDKQNRSYQSNCIKLQQQYMVKLHQIQVNQGIKAQKIREMERRVENKLKQVYENVADKIQEQRRKSEQKYEKLRRLFSLVIQL